MQQDPEHPRKCGMHLKISNHNEHELLSADVKGMFVVEAEAAAQFMHDISKANTAEAGLHLLAAVLSQPSASRDAVAATGANALQVNSPPLHSSPAVAVFCLACSALAVICCKSAMPHSFTRYSLCS